MSKASLRAAFHRSSRAIAVVRVAERPQPPPPEATAPPGDPRFDGCGGPWSIGARLVRRSSSSTSGSAPRAASPLRQHRNSSGSSSAAGAPGGAAAAPGGSPWSPAAAAGAAGAPPWACAPGAPAPAAPGAGDAASRRTSRTDDSHSFAVRAVSTHALLRARSLQNVLDALDKEEAERAGSEEAWPARQTSLRHGPASASAVCERRGRACVQGSSGAGGGLDWLEDATPCPCGAACRRVVGLAGYQQGLASLDRTRPGALIRGSLLETSLPTDAPPPTSPPAPPPRSEHAAPQQPAPPQAPPPRPAPRAAAERARPGAAGTRRSSTASQAGGGEAAEAEQLARLEPVFMNRPLQNMLDIKALEVGSS